MVPKGNEETYAVQRSARHGGRVVLSLDVEAHVRDALRDRAATAGVSMAEYLGNAFAEPERAYNTTAVEIAQPLAQMSYLLAQAGQALERGDVGSAKNDIAAAKCIVAEAMIPLQRRHSADVRAADSRRGGGWGK
jgi:hypothetical protein